MEILIAVISGGIGSGLITLLSTYLQHKWSKKDKTDKRIDALVDAQKVTMIDRVKHISKHYIEAGEISLDDKDNLIEMYNAYKGLGGNGHLDSTMHEIDKLKVIGG